MTAISIQKSDDRRRLLGALGAFLRPFSSPRRSLFVMYFTAREGASETPRGWAVEWPNGAIA